MRLSTTPESIAKQHSKPQTTSAATHIAKVVALIAAATALSGCESTDNRGRISAQRTGTSASATPAPAPATTTTNQAAQNDEDASLNIAPVEEPIEKKGAIWHGTPKKEQKNCQSTSYTMLQVIETKAKNPKDDDVLLIRACTDDNNQQHYVKIYQGSCNNSPQKVEVPEGGVNTHIKTVNCTKLPDGSNYYIITMKPPNEDAKWTTAAFGSRNTKLAAVERNGFENIDFGSKINQWIQSSEAPKFEGTGKLLWALPATSIGGSVVTKLVSRPCPPCQPHDGISRASKCLGDITQCTDE